MSGREGRRLLNRQAVNFDRKREQSQVKLPQCDGPVEALLQLGFDLGPVVIHIEEAGEHNDHNDHNCDRDGKDNEDTSHLYSRRNATAEMYRVKMTCAARLALFV